MTANIPKPSVEIESVAVLIETYVQEAFNKKWDEISRAIRKKLKQLAIALLVSGWSGFIAVLARTL